MSTPLTSDTTGSEPVSSDQQPDRDRRATVIDVLADGFSIKREAVVKCIESDDEIREKVNALAAGRGTDATVEDIHALLKQRLLYER